MIRFIVLLVVVFAPQWALSADFKRGEALASRNCGHCHAIGRTGTSQHAKAPPFRRIANRWPLEQLQEALAEGITVGHPDMPEISFAPDEIDDILAYLNRLRRP